LDLSPPQYWQAIGMGEHDEQVALFEWCSLSEHKYPELTLIYAIPNAGRRSWAAGKRMVKEGLKSGVPDICFPVRRGNFISLYIELKVGKNKPTANQNIWIEKLRLAGHRVEVCYGWVSARQVLEDYLKG